MRYNVADVDGPALELATNAGLEPGRKIFLHLIFITELVTFCNCSLIGVREQRCEPLDIVVRSLEQFGDSDRVVEAPW